MSGRTSSSRTATTRADVRPGAIANASFTDAKMCPATKVRYQSLVCALDIFGKDMLPAVGDGRHPIRDDVDQWYADHQRHLTAVDPDRRHRRIVVAERGSQHRQHGVRVVLVERPPFRVEVGL